jgi:hypothetical protein
MKNFRLFSLVKSVLLFLWARLCAVRRIWHREQETKILVSREVQPPDDSRETHYPGKRRSGRSRKRRKRQKQTDRRQANKRRSARTGKVRRSRRHEGRSRTNCTRSDRRRANERHRRRRDRERRIVAMEAKQSAVAVANA